MQKKQKGQKEEEKEDDKKERRFSLVKDEEDTLPEFDPLFMEAVKKAKAESKEEPVTICRGKNLKDVHLEDGEIVRQYYGQSRGVSTGYSLARIIIPPGKSAPIHYHPFVDEVYVILNGIGTLCHCPVTAEQRGMNVNDKKDKKEMMEYWNECKVDKKLGPMDSAKVNNHQWCKMANNDKDDLVMIVSSAASHIPDCAVLLN